MEKGRFCGSSVLYIASILAFGEAIVEIGEWETDGGA